MGKGLWILAFLEDVLLAGNDHLLKAEGQSKNRVSPGIFNILRSDWKVTIWIG